MNCFFERNIRSVPNKSFFLFGPRGSGKSTFLRQHYPLDNNIFFDLLNPELVHEFSLSPNRFKAIVSLPENREKTIIVDEIQKIPKLLDIVHQLIVNEKRTFILTGSSARRLKQKGVNLLAGRAFIFNLYPFSSQELSSSFKLEKALVQGLLPESYLSESAQDSQEYLKAYCFTYLEKEIQQEQWVRKLDPFRRFLEIAAQSNGQVVNRAKIARDTGVDDMTIQNYYEILEDTLLGFFLPAHHRSVRKQQQLAPKFFLIDMGIRHALARELSIPLQTGTYAFGKAFEHFIILEFRKRIEYARKEWQMSYLRTKDGAEIDLIITRAGEPTAVIEIKSKNKVSTHDVKHLKTLGKDADAETDCFLLSLDPLEQHFDGICACYWEDGLKKIGL